MKATLDKSGRLLLPKALREALNLKPGDTLEVTLEEGHLVLTPLPPALGEDIAAKVHTPRGKPPA